LDEVVSILQKQQEQIVEMTACIEGKNVEIKLLEDTIEDMKGNDAHQQVELVVTEKPEAITEAVETETISVAARPESGTLDLHADSDIIAQINGQN
jgi:predicted transcriptional regulator